MNDEEVNIIIALHCFLLLSLSNVRPTGYFPWKDVLWMLVLNFYGKFCAV